MLSLTRKIGESVIINDNIEVVVCGVNGEQIKLGFVAPKEVSIFRKELYEQIQLENLEATKNSSKDALKNISNKINIDK